MDKVTQELASDFGGSQNTYSRKRKWKNPDGVEGTQSLRFANAWKGQIAGLLMKGIWKEVADKLKQLYAGLTDDDLLLIQGDEDNLMRRLEHKLGMTSHDIRRLIATL